jgi:hypothetical protein
VLWRGSGLSTMGFVVDLGPGAASNSVFVKQMHSVTQVFIASPSLMALAMFSGTLGHGRGTG